MHIYKGLSLQLSSLLVKAPQNYFYNYCTTIKTNTDFAKIACIFLTLGHSELWQIFTGIHLKAVFNIH